MMNIYAIAGRYPWIDATPVNAAPKISSNRDTPEQIANCLNCPYPECVDCIGNACSPRAGMCDRPGRPSTFSDQTLVSLLREGKSDREISAILCVTVNAIRYRKRKLECKSKMK